VRTTKQSSSGRWSRPRPPSPMSKGRRPWLLGLLALATMATMAQSRRLRATLWNGKGFGPGVVLGLMILTAAFWIGCTNYNYGPSLGTLSGTAPGNYQITITGTMNSVTRSTFVNLSVGNP
jgi:hypothetical protein